MTGLNNLYDAKTPADYGRSSRRWRIASSSRNVARSLGRFAARLASISASRLSTRIFKPSTSISTDFRKSYAVIRRAREILGDNRILYVHCSVDPLKDGRIYCPFIDTYADYIIRGEAGVYGLKLDDFLRWTISGYNISNVVGYWCYYGSNRQQGYDSSTPKSYTYFDTLPTAEHIDAALRNKAFIWRQGQEWSQPKLKDDLAAFDKDYYGKIALLRQGRENQGTGTK